MKSEGVEYLNVGLGGSFATWCGTLLDVEKPIILIADPGREGEAALRLGRIGFDGVAGFLDGGMQALDKRPDLEEVAQGIECLTAPELAGQMASPDAPLLLDVRNVPEWQEGHIDGSRNIPLGRLLDQIDELPRDGVVVVHCASGYRSAIGAGLLQRAGFAQVKALAGGMAAWQASRLAVTV